MTENINKPWWNGCYILQTSKESGEQGEYSSLIHKVIGADTERFFTQAALNDSETLDDLPVARFSINEMGLVTGKKAGNRLFTSFLSAQKYAAAIKAPAATTEGKGP
ncbi:hypothetical protein [Agrobacterium fabrum]|uniref:hypothetical protein n=1 Tax=Agrobacterium fabrum TaxID=1176649 RepID=UPI002158643E|nr:hypothetical protein [Agrobacterium fabrum]MCR6722802.1 hypothetical protein [Agrobacterium fabrum]